MCPLRPRRELNINLPLSHLCYVMLRSVSIDCRVPVEKKNMQNKHVSIAFAGTIMPAS